MQANSTTIAALRALISQHQPGMGKTTPTLSPALPALTTGALHDLTAAEADGGALTGFALGLAAETLKAQDGMVLFIATAPADREAGALYGPGLADYGLDPARLLMLSIARPREAFWALETALSCSALTLAIAEIRALDPGLTETRRLALRAEKAGRTALLLRPGGNPTANGAATRWRIAPVSETATGPPDPTAPRWQINAPRFTLNLEKDRHGPPGRFHVEWCPDERRFSPISSLSRNPAPSTASRPDSVAAPAPKSRGRTRFAIAE